MALEPPKTPVEPRPPETDKADFGPVRPFDSRELDKLPRATEDDPHYRPWWAVDST